MYKLIKSPSGVIQNLVQRQDGSIIPSDPANTDYAAYLAWLDEGNMPEPAPIPEPPVELTPAEKLAASGLTVDEIKEILGLSI